MNIYCIPGGGTPASVFFRWKPTFKGIAEIKTLDYSRDESDAPLTAEALAAEFFDKIKDELEGCGEYMLVSSCTGTLIEYELYRLISSAGLALPKEMLVFSAFPPDTDFYKNTEYISPENREYIKDIYAALFKGELFEQPEAAAARCTDFVISNSIGTGKLSLPDKSVISEDCTYEQEIMLGFANNTIKLLSTDWRISQRYHMSEHEKQQIGCHITVIHGTEDRLVPREASEQWRDYAAGGFSFMETDGDHNIITNNTPFCTELIRKLINKDEV